MTVNQLIAKLQEFDSDMEVRMLDRYLIQERFIDNVSVVNEVVYLEEAESR